jgi:hypothetical protein
MEWRGKRLYITSILFFLLIFVSGVWFAFFRKTTVEETPQVTEVTIERGEVSMTLNREGLLTVRIPEGVFQQQWSEERVVEFFSRFESEDLSKFEQPTLGEEGYVLTITTSDGRVITYYITDFSIPLPEIIEELIELLEDVSTITPTPIPTALPTSSTPISVPSPTAPPTLPTPTPTQPASGGGNGGNGGEQTQQPFECDFYDPDQNPDIISETVCTPE